MKKKFLISLAIIIPVVAIIALVCKFIFNKNSVDTNDDNNITERVKKEECNQDIGGSFNIKFNTNGGNVITSMEVIINTDNYQDLPIPVRDGFSFDGWYFDIDLNSKVGVTNSKDIEPISEYDNNNCLIGYKDIDLYAKWNELPKVEVNNSNQEISQNIQIVEPTMVEEQSLPEGEINEETVLNTCGFKKPVEHGKFVNYSMATHTSYNPKYNYFIVTDRQAPIYSVTCGKVYHTFKYKSKFNYKGDGQTPETVSGIYTLSYMDGKFISIIYMEVAESNVNVGDIITNETQLGRAAYMDLGVFVHRLPYINIYIQNGKADIFDSNGGSTIEPQLLIPMPMNEFWDSR
ncbi:MAG: InlB B-repeat-containing protein [Bacilli bacterium]|nr:InlB B-repeat-containing protein [Bacilli bacterium]